MQVNQVKSNYVAPQQKPKEKPAAPSSNKGSSSESNSIIVTDVYEPSAQTKPSSSVQATKAGNNYSADVGRMREIWSEHDRNVESFRRLVETLLNKQIESAGGSWDSSNPNAMVEIDDATRTAAQEAVGEGGAFSVEAVATRLLDFAVAVSGGDPSRIAVLRDAVEKGFAAAEKQWGGELPGISKDTRVAVMQGFDQWQKAGSSSAITLLNRAGSPASPV